MAGSQQARILTRSKTNGPDKAVKCRPMFVDSGCGIHHPTWVQMGWCLLQSLAGYKRDYLMLAPSSSLAGSQGQRELRYDTACAMQNRLFALGAHQIFTHPFSSFWIPHSCRRFMASSTAALGFGKDEQIFFGGWVAQWSDCQQSLCQSHFRTCST